MTAAGPFYVPEGSVLQSTDSVRMEAAAVYDYAGAFSVGVAQAGWPILIKLEDESGFGMEAYRGNLALTGWPDLVADVPRLWPARAVNFVFANPPCSAFSTFMQDPKFHAGGSAGINARQNACMYHVIDYAAKCMADTVVIESVQAAGRAGRPLMRTLRRRLEAATRRHYTMTYVFMNVIACGGYQNRPRFFMVMSRKGPLWAAAADGWERPVSEVIGDLRHAGLEVRPGPRQRRLATLAAFEVDGKPIWRQGAAACDVYAEAIKHGYPAWTAGSSDMIRNQFTAFRWKWDNVAQVITGGFLDDRVHPLEPRTFSYREAARIMGFPDEWDIMPTIRAGAKGKAFFGKGVTVQAGKWISHSVMLHLNDSKGPLEPLPTDGDDEWVIDVSSAWKGRQPPTEQTTLFDGYVDASIRLTPTGRISKAKRDKARR